MAAAVAEVRAISQSALFTVLRQEVTRFDRLLRVLHLSLNSLTLALDGQVLMSIELEQTYDAILHQSVPGQWKVQLSYSCRQYVVVSYDTSHHTFVELLTSINCYRNITMYTDFFCQGKCFWLTLPTVYWLTPDTVHWLTLSALRLRVLQVSCQLGQRSRSANPVLRSVVFAGEDGGGEDLEAGEDGRNR